jgi:hypothetical protein
VDKMLKRRALTTPLGLFTGVAAENSPGGSRLILCGPTWKVKPRWSATTPCSKATPGGTGHSSIITRYEAMSAFKKA